MKDYLNATEKNQIMVLMSIIQVMDGLRNGGIEGPKIDSMIEDWTSRGNMTKEEHRALKTANTNLKKFCESVFTRLDKKEMEGIKKRLLKFDFRLVDDYTLQKVYRDMTDKLKNAVVPRQQFGKWCEEIMDVNCNGCTKCWQSCELHKIFEDNFVPESTWHLDSCRYAYKIESKKVI